MLKNDVYPVGRHCPDRLGQFLERLVLVIDGNVKPIALDQSSAFDLAAGDTKRAAALNLGDLPDNGTRRPRSSPDQDRVSRPRTTNLQQPTLRRRPHRA